MKPQIGHAAAAHIALCALAVASLTLTAPRPAGADTVYQIQRIVTAGDTIDGLRTLANGGHDIEIAALSDAGQIAFTMDDTIGGEVLLQYADNKLSLLVAGGKEGPGLEPGKFIAPHGLALDSKGDIYVGEVSYTNWKTSFPDTPMPPVIRLLQKLERVN